MISVRLALASLLVLVLGGCDPAPVTPGTDAGASGDAPLGPYSPDHTFPALTLTPPESEIQGICQSWTLNNDEPIWVNNVTFDTGEGWHHSNWVYVGEEHFDGPDGTWPCRERDFTEIAAGAAGGGAFFAQSTQSTHEEQRFGSGAAYLIPARSRIIGSVHVINLTDGPLTTAATFHIDEIPEADVVTELRTMAVDNRGIEIPAHAASESRTECDFADALSAPLDMSVYYVLPHYHGLATGLVLEVYGGPNDGTVIFSTEAGIGDPLGAAIDPPVSLTGAMGVRMRCTYMNTGDETVGYGVDAVDEMCTLLAYTDGPRLGGISSSITSSEALPDGSMLHHGDCFAIAP